MSSKLTSLLRHRRLFLLCLLVMSCVSTVFIVSLIPWKSVGQATGNARNRQATVSRSVRILCWIMTDPFDLDERVIHVRDTWARRCDVTLFFSSQTNKTFPTIGIDVPSGKSHLAFKSRGSWTHVFRHHYDDADYFVKADPDTFILVDNLRQYLSHCDPAEPEVFGHRLLFRNVTYFSGATIVLSREALRRLVTVGYEKYSHYMRDGIAEDFKNARCLHEVGARFVDTRDVNGRETFLALRLSHHLFPSGALIPVWYYRYRDTPVKVGRHCCSDNPVAFHYVLPLEMYSFDYLIQISDGFRRDAERGENNDEHQQYQQHHQQQLQQQQSHLQSNRMVLMFHGTKNRDN